MFNDKYLKDVEKIVG